MERKIEKISDLIEALEAFKRRHGDTTVYLWTLQDECCLIPASKVVELDSADVLFDDDKAGGARLLIS